MKTEDFAYEVFMAVAGLVTDHSEFIGKLYDAIDNSDATADQKDNMNLLSACLIEKLFVTGFLQGACWSRGGVVA